MQEIQPYDVGKLLNAALNPRANTSRDPEYRELMRLYLENPEFRHVVGQYAAGLGVRVLDYDASGLVLGTASRNSRFAIRLTEMKRSFTGRDNAGLALVLLAVAAAFYPNANALEDPDAALEVGALSASDVVSVLRKNLKRLSDEEARERVDPLGTVETGWRYLDGLPEGKPGVEDTTSKGTQLGLVRTALQYLAEQAFLDEKNNEEQRVYLPTRRFQIHARQITQDVFRWLLGEGGAMNHRISSLGVFQAGYTEAWYPNFWAALTDEQSGEPLDTLIELRNFGGKTSLLSFLLSTLEPDKSRFLQHVQDRDKVFEDYFDPRGLPAIIAIEWDAGPAAQTDLLGPERERFVTGQLVCYERSDQREYRRFFSFTCGKGLDLAGLFGRGTLPVEQRITGLRTYTQALQWVELMRHEWSRAAEWWVTDNQGSWREHLQDARDLDLQLVRSQLLFNQRESGVEQKRRADTFFQFSSQEDFVQKFIAITLPQDEVEDILATVRDGLNRIREVPRLERRRDLLRRFGRRFEPFAEAARRCNVARAAYREDLAHAAAVRASIESLLATAEQRSANAEATRAQAEEDLEQTTKTEREVGRALAGVAVELARLEASEQEARVKKLREERDRLEAHLTLLLAKRDLDGIRTKQATRQALEEALHREEASLEELRAPALRAGAVLARSLQEAVAEHEAQIEQLDQRILDHQTKRAEAERDVQRLGEVRDRERSRRDRAEAAIGAADEARGQRIAAGDLLEGEDSRDAHARLQGALQEVEKEAVRLRKVAGELDGKRRSLHTEEVQLAGDKTGLERDVEGVRDRIDAAQQAEQKLRGLALLTTLMETTEFDFPVAVERVTELIQRCESQLLQCGVVAERLQKDAESIRVHGVAGVSPEVDPVVDLLRRQGVADAQPYGVYIANTLPDAGAARALFLQDVARFSGVCVPTGDALAQAKQAGTELELARAVVVSTGTTSVSPAVREECTVLGPHGDEMFNREAAAALLARLDQKQAKNQEEQRRLSRRRSDAQEGLDGLQRYLQAYGAGQREELARRAEALDGQIGQLDDRLGALALEMERLDTRAAQVDEALADGQGQRDEITARLVRLSTYKTGHEDHLPGHLGARDEARKALATLAKEEERLLSMVKMADEGVQAANKAKEPFLRESSSLTEKLGRVQHRADGWEQLGVPDESLQRLSAHYETARAAYEDRLQGHSRDLSHRIGDLAQEIGALQNRYQQDFGDCDPEQVEAQSWVNFQAERHERERRLRAVEERGHQADKRSGELQNAYKQAAARPHTPYVSPEPPTVEGLEDVSAALHERVETLCASRTRLEERLPRLREEEKAAAGAVQTLKDAHAFVRDARAPEPAPPVAEVSFAPAEAAEVAQDAYKRYQESNHRQRQAEDKMREHYDPVRNALAEENFHTEEPALRGAFLANGDNIDAMGRDVDVLLEKLSERVEVLEHEIASMDETLDFCAKETEGLVAKGRRVLKRSLTKYIPDTVRVVGGQPILTMNVSALEVPDLPAIMRDMLVRMMRDDRVPDSGHALVAAGIQEILDRTGRSLDVKILKPLIGSFEHVEVHKTKPSGGQGLSIPIYLYLLVTKLRAEERRRTHAGGVLILDNPIGVASSQDLIETQLSLARQLDVQLIYLTGILDLNATSQFRGHIRLRQGGVEPSTGRKHIEVAHYQMREAV